MLSSLDLWWFFQYALHDLNRVRWFLNVALLSKALLHETQWNGRWVLLWSLNNAWKLRHLNIDSRKIVVKKIYGILLHKRIRFQADFVRNQIFLSSISYLNFLKDCYLFWEYLLTWYYWASEINFIKGWSCRFFSETIIKKMLGQAKCGTHIVGLTSWSVLDSQKKCTFNYCSLSWHVEISFWYFPSFYIEVIQREREAGNFYTFYHLAYLWT